MQLNMPQPKVPPVSSITVAAISSWRSRISSAARESTARRSPGPVVDHAGNAAFAASTAARASSRPAADAVDAASPVKGLIASNVAPEPADATRRRSGAAARRSPLLPSRLLVRVVAAVRGVRSPGAPTMIPQTFGGADVLGRAEPPGGLHVARRGRGSRAAAAHTEDATSTHRDNA